MTANSNAESLRFALALSSLATIAIIVYVVVLINTLFKIWNAEFQDMQEKIFWFLFVLVLSPIGIPLYLYKRWKQRADKSTVEDKGAGAEKGQASQAQRPQEHRSQEQRSQEQRSQEHRSQEQRSQEQRSQEQRSQEQRSQEQRSQEQQPQEQRPQEQRPREARVQQPSGLSDAERARELARLLEMKKNGILSTEEFNRAKQRLSA